MDSIITIVLALAASGTLSVFITKFFDRNKAKNDIYIERSRVSVDNDSTIAKAQLEFVVKPMEKQLEFFQRKLDKYRNEQELQSIKQKETNRKLEIAEESISESKKEIEELNKKVVEFSQIKETLIISIDYIKSLLNFIKKSNKSLYETLPEIPEELEEYIQKADHNDNTENK